MDRQQLLAAFERGYNDLKATLDALPPAVLTYKPAPQEWSAHEIVVHLTDSEAVGFARFRWAIAQPGITITAYDQDLWANQTTYAQQDLALCLQVFQQLRASTAQLLRSLPADLWEGWIQHPERGKETLDAILKRNADHVALHIDQIHANHQHWMTNGAGSEYR